MGEPILEVLQFKREAMTQMLLVGPLMAGLAMGGLTLLLASQERSPLRARLLVGLTASLLLFIFGAALAAVILPGMGHALAIRSVAQASGFVFLSQVVVLSLLLGSLVLAAALGFLGYCYSRAVGLATLTVAVLTTIVFAACCIHLDQVARR